MFYLIVAILIASFYFFIAPKSVKNTMNLLFVMATLALLLLLAVLSIIKFFSLPGEFFVTVGMLALSYFTLKDFFAMPEPNRDKAQQDENKQHDIKANLTDWLFSVSRKDYSLKQLVIKGKMVMIQFERVDEL